MLRTMIASTVLTLGTGIALAQPASPSPASNIDTSAQTSAPADAPDATDEQATAPEDGAAAAASAVVAGSTGAAVAADVQTASDSPPDAEELAKQKRAEKKAKRKAQCLAVNVGKPKDC
jgi:hypothetical protein